MSLRRSPRFLAILLLATVLGPLSMQMFLPALPAIQRDFATSAGTAQLTLTVAMLAIGVATFAFGPFADAFGRRPVLLVGIVIFLGGSLLGALADSIALLIVARIFQSGGASAGIVLARAMVRDVYGRENSIRVISYLTMAMVAAPTLAPALGGVIADASGWRTIFWALCAVGVITLVAVAWGLEETHKDRGPPGWRSLLDGCRQLLGIRRFLGYSLLSSWSIAVYFAFLAAAPYLTVEALHLSARDAGFWMIPVSIFFMFGTFVATRFLDRWGPDNMIRGGTIFTVVACALMVPMFLFLPLGIGILFLPQIVICFIQGFIIPNAQASAINIDPRYAGTASGLTGFMQMALGAAVAQIVAEIADGTVWPMVIMMSGSALIGLLCLPLIRGPSHSGPSQPGPAHSEPAPAAKTA